MSKLRRNIVANFAGRGSATALGLIFPPIYARLLGVESYGLIGVWTALTSLASVLDLGLSTTLTREMARYSGENGEQSPTEMRDVVRTIETIFWAVGSLTGAVIALLAPVISQHWVRAEHLSEQLVTNSIRTIGLAFALQWPLGIYTGGLLGLQNQVLANVIQSGFGFVRSIGAAVVIWKITRSIDAFLVWQACVIAAQTLATRTALVVSLPATDRRPSFRWALLRRNWQFSAGMSLISILAIALTQSDKLIVSKLLTLEQFGYYTLGWTVAGAITNLISPVFQAVFPLLSQLVKQNESGELSRIYHMSCQLASAMVLPAAAVLALFSREVLSAWSGDARIVEMTSPILAIIATGAALNGLMNVPYALQLAFGWTRLTVITNIIAVVIIVPLEYWLATLHGTMGAAAGYLILNAAYVLLVIPAMHRRLLLGEQWRWYLVDVGLPFLGMAIVLLPLRSFVYPTGGRLATLAWLLGIGLAAMAGAVAAAPGLRSQARRQLEQWFQRSPTSDLRPL